MRSTPQPGVRGQRERISLDGTWDFYPQVGRSSIEPGQARSIEVPGAWQAQFEDLRSFSGRATYRRSIAIPSSWAGRTVRLCFGAVDYLCEVFVNERPAGAHEGGYLPFSFDVTALLRWGEDNQVTVVVTDVGPGDSEPASFDEIPHGKQSWYGPVGGIWQSVFLETTTAKTFVEEARIRPDLASGAVSVDVQLSSPAEASDVLFCHATSPAGTQTWSGWPVELAPASATAQLELQIGDIEAWSPRTPALYRLDISLSRNGQLLDQWSDRFGFRSISTRDGALLLNGEPLYLLGALDQDYYLDTICTPPSTHLLRHQVLRAKELGLNCLRCHIKVPDPRYLRAADELGMLVWAELPNWNQLTDATRKRARATFAGMVARDFNHPSIVIWTIANESWGLDLSDESHRGWLEDTFTWAKELDPTRLVVDNSACPPNFHVRSDLNDFHLYRAFPDHARSWRAWTKAWVADPSATYSPHGDAYRSGEEPLILSEFGNWGLPDVFELRDEGADPWWFQTGAEREDGVALPEGVLERFESWGLADVFGSWQDFVAHSQEHQFDGLRESIWDLRSHREIAGYVITELTDVHWEANGLLDMARNPKSYHHRFSQVNAEDIVMLRPQHRRYWAGETAEVEVLVSHYSTRDLSDFSVMWRLAGTELRGTLSGAVGRGDVAEAGRCSFEAPVVTRPGPLALEAVLRDGRSRSVGRTELELLLFPAHPQPPAVPVWSSVGAPALAARGWQIAAELGAAAVAVAERWDSRVAAFVSSGGRAVILVQDEDAFPEGSSLAIHARAGSRWEGDWAQGMGFLRPELHEALGSGPRQSSLFEAVTADHVVTGYGPAARSDILGGYYLGWLRDLVATVGAFREGSGQGIVCALPVLDGYARDPLATALLDRLIELAASPNLNPSTSLT